MKTRIREASGHIQPSWCMLQASSQRLHPVQADGSLAIQMGLTKVVHQNVSFRYVGGDMKFSRSRYWTALTSSYFLTMRRVSSGCIVYRVLASPFGMKRRIM